MHRMGGRSFLCRHNDAAPTRLSYPGLTNIINQIARSIFCVASIIISSCVIHPAQAIASSPPASSEAAQIEAGRKIYNFRCYFCHGYSGNAQTVAASLLSPPPLDFTRADSTRFTPSYIVEVLHNGKPGTAMQPFRNILSEAQMQQVADFVVNEFILQQKINTHYHTAENGWPDHQRYQAAFPFALGEIPVNRPWETLSDEQARGKRLFLSACVVCHDRGVGKVIWDARPLSYPRNFYSNKSPTAPSVDAMSSASPYLIHDTALPMEGLTAQEHRGEKLFQDNCAFCHAADGTGKNWIGSFLDSHPRNLRDPVFMGTMTRARLTATIRDGLPNTSMPAWKSVLNAEEIAAIVAYVAKAFHSLPE